MLFNYCGWFLFLCLLFCYWCFCLVVFYGDWKVCDGNYLFPFCWEPYNTVQYFITPCNTKQWKWCTGSYLSPFCWGLVNEKSTFSPTQIEVKFKGHCKLYVVYFRHLKWQHHYHHHYQAQSLLKNRIELKYLLFVHKLFMNSVMLKRWQYSCIIPQR